MCAQPNYVVPAIRINSADVFRCETEWSWRPRDREDFCLFYVWAGRGEMRWADQRIELSSSSAFCLYPDMPYQATHDPQKPLGICMARFDFLDRRGRITYPQDLPVHFCTLEPSRFHETIFRRAVNVWHERAGKYARALAERLLQSILLEMRLRAGAGPKSASGATDEIIHIAMRHIREYPGQLVSVETLAERSGFSPERFSRLFQKIAGVTPKEFSIRTRMQRAAHLLRESDLSVEQISRALGYADVYFFSRQFKQRFGQSPTAWKKG